MKPMRDDRSILKLVLLSIITLGIYEIWYLHHWIKDINELCKEDGKHNEGVLLLILLSLVTCGMFGIFWWFKVGDRLSRAGVRESVAVDISGGKMALLTFLGMIFFGVFTIYAEYLAIQATNELAMNYNQKHVYAMSVIDAGKETDNAI